jgi:hypothetical protein
VADLVYLGHPFGLGVHQLRAIVEKRWQVAHRDIAIFVKGKNLE